MAITRLAGIVFIFFLLLGWLKEWALIPIALVILYFLIRFIADIFWWGRDNDKW